VAGLAGFLIALAILIGVIGYALSKPLDTKAAKYVIAAALVIGLGVVIIFLWLSKASPFFNADTTCNPFAKASGTGCGTDCVKCCINKKPTTIMLAKHPPLRYAYPIFQIPSSQGSDFTPGLLQMCIAKAGQEEGSDTAGKNGGWNGKIWNSLDDTGKWKYDTTSKSFGVDPLPNPLTIPKPPTKDGCSCNGSTGIYFEIPKDSSGISSGIASATGAGPDCRLSCTSDITSAIAETNADEWYAYINTGEKYASHARFVCCSYLGIPCDAYTVLSDGEGEEISTDISREHAFNFSNYKKPTIPGDAINGGGQLDGLMGVCDNRLYQLHVFMGKLGWYILLGIVFIIIVYVDLKHNNSGPSGKPGP
jgi:hypothetical protein